MKTILYLDGKTKVYESLRQLFFFGLASLGLSRSTWDLLRVTGVFRHDLHWVSAVARGIFRRDLHWVSAVARGILVSPAAIKPVYPALEGRFVTTG